MTSELPGPFSEDWRRAGDRSVERRLALVSVRAETTVYEHVPTAETLEALRDGGAIPARSLFAVETAFDPSLSAVGLSPADAMELAAPKATAQFVDTLEDDGISVGAERFDESVERPDGTVGQLSVHAATYPVDGSHATDADAAAPDAADANAAATDATDADAAATSTTDAAVPSAIDAEAHVAVWPTADAFAMAGGVLPLEAPAGLEGLDVDVGRDRTTVLDFVRRVSLEETG